MISDANSSGRYAPPSGGVFAGAGGVANASYPLNYYTGDTNATDMYGLNDINNDNSVTAGEIIQEADTIQLIGDPVTLTAGTTYANVDAQAVTWQLSQPSTLGGYIIQQVAWTKPDGSSGAYSEAWYVAPGASAPLLPTNMPWE